jgi:hypothetical protein
MLRRTHPSVTRNRHVLEWSAARNDEQNRSGYPWGYLTESAAASASSDPRYQVAQCRRDAPPSRVGATRRHAHLPRVCDVWHDAPSARCSEARRAGARHARRKPRRAAATRTADSPREVEAGAPEASNGRRRRPAVHQAARWSPRHRGRQTNKFPRGPAGLAVCRVPRRSCASSTHSPPCSESPSAQREPTRPACERAPRFDSGRRLVSPRSACGPPSAISPDGSDRSRPPPARSPGCA